MARHTHSNMGCARRLPHPKEEKLMKVNKTKVRARLVGGKDRVTTPKSPRPLRVRSKLRAGFGYSIGPNRLNS